MAAVDCIYVVVSENITVEQWEDRCTNCRRSYILLPLLPDSCDVLKLMLLESPLKMYFPPPFVGLPLRLQALHSGYGALESPRPA